MVARLISVSAFLTQPELFADILTGVRERLLSPDIGIGMSASVLVGRLRPQEKPL